MNFIVRGARPSDIDDIYDIAQQFSLLNLPADKSVIEKKINKSIRSFKGELPFEEGVYLFVAEELETRKVAGSSQIVAKHGTADDPNYSVQVLKKERFSPDLGVGFIHQILRLRINEDGPTELGGLVVSKAFRGRPEKIGKLMSLARFLYIGMEPKRFSKELHAELAPPLTEDGKSHFWEAFGRRFTGMPYHEADALSHENKEFIRSLFPEEDVYLCLLDSKARLALGRVGDQTRPALHMLEGLGFKYKNEVDPFDGGPHIGAAQKDVSLIKNGKMGVVMAAQGFKFEDYVFVSVIRDGEFFCGQSAAHIQDKKLALPERTLRALQLGEGERVYFTPIFR